MVISEHPNVLVLHLKRFSYGNMFAKITKSIQFSADLVLPAPPSSFNDNGATAGATAGAGAIGGGGNKGVKYELFGVVVHHGSSTHSGHYIAYVKVWFQHFKILVVLQSLLTIYMCSHKKGLALYFCILSL